MNNVEDQFINIHILEAQQIELRYVLGDELYDDIISEYTDYAEAGYQNINNFVSEKNQNLRNEYIKWVLLYYTLYHSIYDLDTKMTNKGIENQHSNYSINADISRIEKRRNDYQNIAETYVSRMLDYIMKNIEDYPLYKDFIKCDTNNTNNFESGWYLGPEL